MAILYHQETATQDEDLNGFQIREMEDHLMAREALDDQMETDHRLEDHLVEDRQVLDFQIQIHQVHQEILQVQLTIDDVNTNQIDVFEM